MLLLCKKCNIVLFNFIDDDYKYVHIHSTPKQIEYVHVYYENCDCCFLDIGIRTTTICTQCLFKKNIIDKKNFINYDSYHIENFFYTCYFCEDFFNKILYLKKNNIVSKIL